MVSDRPRKFKKKTDVSMTPADPGTKASLIDSIRASQNAAATGIRNHENDVAGA
jgi:hypothetical protein